MTPSDQELIALIRDQDTDAFETLSLRYRELIYPHVLHTVRDNDAAEDVVQEVFLRIWTRAEQWNSRGSFKAWLFRIATNMALNHLRTLKRRRQQAFAQVLQEWNEAGREIREHNVTKSFSVLARAMRAEHPSLVFAHAAATGEIDPLTDLDSRLFVVRY